MKGCDWDCAARMYLMGGRKNIGSVQLGRGGG